MPPGRWLLAGSLALLALPAHADVADCRDSLFLDRNLVAADDFCEAAVAADPTDQEARFFRAITRLLRFTLDSDVHQLLDEAGLSEEGRDVFDFRAELPTNTLGQGVRRGTTIDFHPFTVTAGGAVGVDVLSWEQDVEDVDGDFRFDEPVDVNGDGEIAFFDAEIFVLQDDGSLDVADLVAQNDDAGLGEGRTDGSVSSLDSFLSVALAP
ncbi:MAG TPA: hypothetical protein VFG80_08380, partial [Myxococcota bacterium]|nr:hypothetical protein [Myxococcota bacterium]